MIGILLTGHGRFSEGLVSSLDMIAGKQKALEYVNFLEADSTEMLEAKMRELISSILKETDGVLIACDLMGGTPFKVAATLSVETDKLAVIGGVNLPSILEALFSRENMNTADELAQAMTESDAGHMIKFVMPQAKVQEDSEDGI